MISQEIWTTDFKYTIQMTFKLQTFQQTDHFLPFEYRTGTEFRSPLYILAQVWGIVWRHDTKANTVGIWNLTIRNPDFFKIRFQMVPLQVWTISVDFP